ncbi:hypothetical protein G4B88_011011 [Cannabis sativa]|uniref:Uncharacterized protein n=1 Tax=Cannabis sativa TaxID=3483 RepID=A0A7J6HJX1_CANSA|nr:hypothetical protein G4B88_011011 [Cannabis sativa]
MYHKNIGHPCLHCHPQSYIRMIYQKGTKIRKIEKVVPVDVIKDIFDALFFKENLAIFINLKIITPQSHAPISTLESKDSDKVNMHRNEYPITNKNVTTRSDCQQTFSR